MIQGFRNTETRAFFEGYVVLRFVGFAAQATRRLTVLHDATSLADLAGLPSNRLEKLVGDRAGQYSIRINLRWRICFSWSEDGPYDVEIVDYHR